MYQQLLYRRKFPFVKVLSRSRLEERFIDNTDGTAVRVRTMLRGDFPLPDAPEWAIVAYDEIFVNLNSVGWSSLRIRSKQIFSRYESPTHGTLQYGSWLSNAGTQQQPSWAHQPNQSHHPSTILYQPVASLPSRRARRIQAPVVPRLNVKASDPRYPPSNREGEAKPLPLADCVTLVRLSGPHPLTATVSRGAAIF